MVKDQKDREIIYLCKNKDSDNNLLYVGMSWLIMI